MGQSTWFNASFHTCICNYVIMVFLLITLYHQIKKNIYTFNEFVDTDTIYNNFVEYNSIISASPNIWKQIISLEAIQLVVK